MPKSSTLDNIKTWQERIRAGQRFSIKHAGAGSWDRYKNYYRQGGNTQVIKVNLMYSILRNMIPQVYFRNPKVSITARKPGLEAELNARIIEKLDNWLLTELATKREFKKMIADTFFCGIGIGFFGYDSMYGFSDKLTDPTGQFSLSQFDSAGNRIEFDSSVNPGMPWFLRANPIDVVFPPGATSQEALEWVALRVFRKLRDVQSDKKYSNTSNLQGTHEPVRTFPEGNLIRDLNLENANVDPDDMWLELWEIHDARADEVKALTMDSDKFLRKEADTAQIEGLPVETIVFNPDPDFIYGIPDARIIEPLLLELSDIRTQSKRHRSVDIIKGLIRKDALPNEEIAKLTSPEVQALISVDSDAASLRDIYMPLAPGVSGILQDLALQGNIVSQDVRDIVGFSRNAQGDFQGKTHISAEEVSRVAQTLDVRMSERRDAMADLLGKVVRKWNQIIFERWTQERIAQITGPDGAKWWLKFTGPQIRDEYDLHVEASEGPPMDSKTKKELGFQAAEIWAKLNAGAIKAGQPVPAEIQRLIFNQFQDTGLDIDRLLAQTQAQGQALQQMMGGKGGSPSQAISPAVLAQAQGAAR